MTPAKIAIVEDEAIVAEDIRQMISGLGYDVVGLAATAEEAYALVKEKSPDLVLMDIRIKGKKDGIDAAEQILIDFNVPVTFVTAYVDDLTLERAKSTLPYGYIVKPFDEKDLSSTIKMALYRHVIQETLDGMDKWYSTAMRNLPWGVITADTRGKINYVNPAGEALLGRSVFELIGQELNRYFPSTLFSEENKAASHKIVRGDSPITLISSKTAMKGEVNEKLGQLIIFHEESQKG